MKLLCLVSVLFLYLSPAWSQQTKGSSAGGGSSCCGDPSPHAVSFVFNEIDYSLGSADNLLNQKYGSDLGVIRSTVAAEITKGTVGEYWQHSLTLKAKKDLKATLVPVICTYINDARTYFRVFDNLRKSVSKEVRSVETSACDPSEITKTYEGMSW